MLFLLNLANTLRPRPLAEALEKSETVQAAVQQSVTELLVINMVLQQEVPADALAGDVAQALQQTEKIETLLRDSADELARVNRAPKRETDEREDLEQALQQGQRQTGAGRRAQTPKRFDWRGRVNAGKVAADCTVAVGRAQRAASAPVATPPPRRFTRCG